MEQINEAEVKPISLLYEQLFVVVLAGFIYRYAIAEGRLNNQPFLLMALLTAGMYLLCKTSVRYDSGFFGDIRPVFKKALQALFWVWVASGSVFFLVSLV